MRIRALALATVTIATTMITAIAPIQAQALTGTDAGAGNCGAFYGVSQQLCPVAGQKTPPIGTGSDSITFSCSAVTPGASASLQTGVFCYLLGLEHGDVHRAPTVWTDGTASTTSATASSGLISTSYQICVGAGYISGGTSTGIVNYNCTNPL